MKPLVFSILTMLSYATVLGQTTLSKSTIKLLDSIATQDVPTNAPGIATAVIENGKVIYETYAGYADLTDSTLIKSDTRFNIASNGKQFTALAILNLINQKKLKLTDDIRTWFPNLYPAINEKITVQSLINHSSGIRDCYDLWSLQGYTWWEQSFNNVDVLSLISQQNELNFQPESQYLYSNTNYILLALIAEKVTQQTFVDYTNDMFKQLNMPHTSFESDAKNIRGPTANSYFNFGTWTTYDWIWNVCGDGNLFSTLKDQIQWEQLVQGAGETTFNRAIISQSQQLPRDSELKNYGYGLEFADYKGLSYQFHEGATGAWKATVVRFPERKVSILTLTNSGKSIPAMQTRQMADAVLQLKSDNNSLVTEPSVVGSYVSDEVVLGIYLTENDFAFTFYKKDNNLFLNRVGRNDVAIVREADNIFHQTYDPLFKQEFTTNSIGEQLVTAYYTSHAPYTLKKVKTIAKDFDFIQFNGDYINDETNTTISINYLSDTNYKITFRQDYETTGLLISSTKMLVDFYNIEFEEGNLVLNGDRIKKLRYVRK